MIEIKKKKPDEERMIEGLRGLTTKHLSFGSSYAEKLRNLILEDPSNGVRKIKEIYDEALDKSYTDKDGNHRGYVQAMCGGPFEAVPRAICNAVGYLYPVLTRENKNLALSQLLKIVDKERYDIVQRTFMEGIREPLLFSDIVVLRGLYWCGLDEGREIMKKYGNFQDIKDNLIDENGLFSSSVLSQDFKELMESSLPVKQPTVNSDFLVAYSFLRSDMCDFGEEYAEVANPEFLDRTMHGIVAIFFGGIEDEKKIEEDEKKIRKLLPKSLHPRINPIRDEKGWVDQTEYEKQIFGF